MNGSGGVGTDACEVLDALPDAVILMDTAGDLVWGNPAAEALFGRSVEDSVGTNALDLIHPDDQNLAIVSIASVQAKDVGTPLEVRVRGPEGWRLVEVIGRPFGDDLILISLRDLTERRRWEVAGSETERARVLIQNGASITMLVRPDGVVETTSAAITRSLRLDQEAVEGAHLSEIVHPDDHHVIERAITDVRPGAALTVEARLTTGDGTWIPFALTFVDLRDDPTVEGLVVSGHGIADRVRVEHELRGALSMLQATFDSTTDGILVVDHEGRITGRNTRFMEMWSGPSRPAGRSNRADDPEAIARAASRLRDPQAFLATVGQMAAMPEASSSDRIEFLDGRVYERESRPQRIDGKVVGRVWSFRDVTDTVQLQEQLIHQAFHDPLTGLANQALFRDRVEHATARSDRQGTELAVLFVDVDDFKTINDSLGHAAGDELLRIVAERLRECVRGSDTVARLGGDEFAVLVEDSAVGEPEIVAERIIETVHRPITIGGREVVVSASVGIALGSGSPAADLLRNADLAMYTAKANGKDRHRTFAPAMFDAALERLEVEASLRGAAARGELLVHYQPVVDMVSGAVSGFEALVRWQHPERGLVQPSGFIPFAEQSGLITEIGTHVLETACREASGWLAACPDTRPTMSVNLSPNQLLEPDLAQRVGDILDRTGLPPELLCLEITEGALMHDPLAAIDALRSLREIGLRLAVDDFGTGYSSLAYLQRFPIDILKVDQSFVSDLTGAPDSPMVSAIVRLALTLGVTPLAEGIETPEQAELLVSFGCRLAQGYLFGHPADAATSLDLLAGGSVTPERRPVATR
jgi:diguanylate cyclase (GGDEF)-like protein/PAS domain S-box-containing protein